jgi:NSS family neurotransmitter:Na+ symporter
MEQGAVNKKAEFWSSRAGFILASMGSAIGLGSIWKFPYEVGSNGGGGFVLFYLLGLGLIVLPLMLVEFSVGRRGRADAMQSINVVAQIGGGSRAWSTIGALGVVTSCLILSYYSVVGGWALAYTFETVTNTHPGTTADAVRARYDVLLASPVRMTGYHLAFMVMTGVIVARGIAGGIEQACKFLMPILIVLIAALALYSLLEGDFFAALRFLFAIDFSAITPKVALEAIGLGFFSIGVGLAIMITYAAYSAKDVDLVQAAIVTLVSDTAISFLAGLAIFPIVFAEKLDPSSGPGLMFVTVPLAFARMPFGGVAAFLFFVLLSIAALASAMSMLEMPVAFLHRQYGWSRRLAALISGTACWILGLGTVFSFNWWANWFPLAALRMFENATLFELLDDLTSNLLLPVGGLGLAIFSGWAIPTRLLADELRLRQPAAKALRFLMRYVAPLGIAAAALAPAVL